MTSPTAPDTQTDSDTREQEESQTRPLNATTDGDKQTDDDDGEPSSWDVRVVPDETIGNGFHGSSLDNTAAAYGYTWGEPYDPVENRDVQSGIGVDEAEDAGMVDTAAARDALAELDLKDTVASDTTDVVGGGEKTPTNLDSPTAQYEAVMAAMAALKKSKSLQQIKSLVKKKAEQIVERLSPEKQASAGALTRDITVTFKMGTDNVNLMESSMISLPRGIMEASITSLPRSASDLSTGSSLAWSEFGSVCGWDPTGRGMADTDNLEEEDLDDDNEETMEVFDEGDIHWVWVSPTACPIQDEAEVRHWLAAEAGSNRSSSIFYQRQFTSGTWRNTILASLRTRIKAQHDPFRHYPLAIERVSRSSHSF